MSKIWNDIVAFVKDGNNLYYIIGAAIVVLLLIIVIAVAVRRGKKSRLAIRQVDDESAVAAALAPSDKPVSKKSEVAERKKSSQSDDKLNRVVEVKPVPKKEKPAPPPPEEDAPKKQEDSAEKEEAKLKRPGVIQIYKDNGGKFRFRLKASNNETIAHSQGYATKAGCKNGIKAVQAIVDISETYDTTKAGEEYKVTIGQPAFEIYKDNEGKFRFRLRAANTNNVLASQGYTTKDNCINGIRSVKHVANNSSLADDTLVK